MGNLIIRGDPPGSSISGSTSGVGKEPSTQLAELQVSSSAGMLPSQLLTFTGGGTFDGHSAFISDIPDTTGVRYTGSFLSTDNFIVEDLSGLTLDWTGTWNLNMFGSNLMFDRINLKFDTDLTRVLIPQNKGCDLAFTQCLITTNDVSNVSRFIVNYDLNFGHWLGSQLTTAGVYLKNFQENLTLGSISSNFKMYRSFLHSTILNLDISIIGNTAQFKDCFFKSGVRLEVNHSKFDNIGMTGNANPDFIFGLFISNGTALITDLAVIMCQYGLFVVNSKVKLSGTFYVAAASELINASENTVMVCDSIYDTSTSNSILKGITLSSHTTISGINNFQAKHASIIGDEVQVGVQTGGTDISIALNSTGRSDYNIDQSQFCAIIP
jgi:hypothetical protein